MYSILYVIKYVQGAPKNCTLFYAPFQYNCSRSHEIECS